MPSTLSAAAAALAGMLFWTLLGLSVGRHIVPRALALPLAPALGWGAFDVPEFVPGRSLVLASHLTHESAYYAARHGGTSRTRLYFQQGLALALMYLLDSIGGGAETPVGPGSYDALFRGGARFDTLESRSPLRGDEVCEVTVELASE